jgi:hypothetical protein
MLRPQHLLSDKCRIHDLVSFFLDFFVIQFHLASISKFYKQISPRPEFQILPAKNPKSPSSWGGVYPHELAVCQRAEFDCMGALGVYGG